MVLLVKECLSKRTRTQNIRVCPIHKLKKIMIIKVKWVLFDWRGGVRGLKTDSVRRERTKTLLVHCN